MNGPYSDFPSWSQITFYGCFFELGSMRAHFVWLLCLFGLCSSTRAPPASFFHDILLKRPGQLLSKMSTFLINLMVSLWCHLAVSSITCVSSNLQVKTQSLITAKLNMAFGNNTLMVMLSIPYSFRKHIMGGCSMISDAKCDHAVIKLRFSLYNQQLIST